MGFDRLHPLLRHHIVNSLGWRGLRPLQEAAVDPVLDGEHGMFLAPTAGGKTEAALFPVLSRILAAPTPGLRLLYICPIKALLNNLSERLSYYAGLLGLRAEVWHGDTPESRRRALRKEPPEILLTTPESLEVLLVSQRVDKPFFFGGVRFCIIDEIHAFAGDDRGRHLLAVLGRIEAYAPEPLQRLGLSATVGNPEDLLGWLIGPSRGKGRVIAPPATGGPTPEVVLDYVGSLDNAAMVISRLHRGEKRLVFVDSRARVEELALILRRLGVATFVSHGSLGMEARKAAETAFAQGENCVIVATSTLELGIDVGDLDRVIQIDAPATVASFLQRIGRTGRRAGTATNCLFLATDEDPFLRAAALLHLWRRGYVEPVVPPARPYHILAQQLMALCLQRGAMTPPQLEAAAAAGFADIDRGERRRVLAYMIQQGILQHQDGLIWMGDEGEAQFGRKNFMELFAVFTAPPLFTVFHGRKEIGQVHEHTFTGNDKESPTHLTLGGFSWVVGELDWRRKIARVVPAEASGKSRWLGSGVPLSFELCQAVAEVQAEGLPEPLLTRRGRDKLAQLQEDTSHLQAGSLVNQTWWTYAGSFLNEAAAAFFKSLDLQATASPLNVTFKTRGDHLAAIQKFQALAPEQVKVPLSEEMLFGLKFHTCLPKEQIYRLFAARLNVAEAFKHVRGLAVLS